MAKQQIHKAKIAITCDLEIPQYQKDKGIEFDLMANEKLVGQLIITGAHVYFRKTRRSKWSHWSFSDFAELLEANKK